MPYDPSGPRARVLLIGLGTTTHSALESLAERFEVVGLVRDGAADDPTLIKAKALGVRVFGDTTMKGIDALVTELRPDAVAVSSYHRILPAELLAKSRFVNVHYAPLPKYRGRANVNWAVINGESCTAISIHTMVPGLDAGRILYQELIPIRDTDTIVDLYDRLNAIQRRELAAAVQRYLDGDPGAIQDEREATYGCTRTPDDGEINWSASTLDVSRLVRALVPPLPGAFTFHEGRRLVVWHAEPLADPPRYEGRVPGRVIGTSKKNGAVDVLTGDGVLRLFEVQRDGEARTAAANVVRSVKDTLGLRTVDLFHRLAAVEDRLAELERRAGRPEDK
jgi:methionyl-tRNA formyltransferase